ncbi:hypothetical protein [Pseudoduganella sp. UC29_71]
MVRYWLRSQAASMPSSAGAMCSTPP